MKPLPATTPFGCTSADGIEKAGQPPKPSPADPDEHLLVTQRLILRRARGDDLLAMHRILSAPQAMLYWSTPPHGSLVETEQWLQSMIDASAEESNDFIMELNGAVIGKAGCWRLPEIGFILHPDHWGRGLAREALQAVIGSTFARFRMPELVADADPRNVNCLRLLERLGFKETGRASRTWFVNGQWTDSVYLARQRDAASNDLPKPRNLP